MLDTVSSDTPNQALFSPLKDHSPGVGDLSNANQTSTKSRDNQPESFADALQTRLNQISLNKSVSSSQKPVASQGIASGKHAAMAQKNEFGDLVDASRLSQGFLEAVGRDAGIGTESTEVGDLHTSTPEDNTRPTVLASPADASLTPLTPETNPGLQAAIANANISPIRSTIAEASTINQTRAGQSNEMANGPSITANFADQSEKSASALAGLEGLSPKPLVKDSFNSTGATAESPKQSETGNFQEMLNNRVSQSNVAALSVTGPQHGAGISSAREISSPIGSSNWATDIGNQVSWMAKRGESRADLVLNPPQLGRIEVSITMNGDQASANFVSTNAEVRNALEGSLPRLREVLADAGIFLGQADVGTESFKQSQNGAEKGGKSPGDSFSSGDQPLLVSADRPLSIVSEQIRQGRGLIDLFA